MPPAHSSLPPSSGAARALAGRLFAHEVRGQTSDDELIAAGERVCTLVAGGTSRWFGPYGSRALLTRALARAQADHPAIAEVAIGSETSWRVTGLSEGAKTHGANATVEGVVAILAALAELIGRLIGEDLATTLLEQSVAMSPSSDATTTVDMTADAKQAARPQQTGKSHG